MAILPVLSRVTVPVTGTPGDAPKVRVNVCGFTVAEFIALANVAVMAGAVVETLTALAAGVVETTAFPVLKLQLAFMGKAFPAKSFAPVVMVAV